MNSCTVSPLGTPRLAISARRVRHHLEAGHGEGHGGGEAEIWIANIAYNDEVRYHVLYFAHDEFTTRDNTKLDYSRDGDNWLLNADGNDFYKIPDAVIVIGVGLHSSWTPVVLQLHASRPPISTETLHDRFKMFI